MATVSNANLQPRLTAPQLPSQKMEAIKPAESRHGPAGAGPVNSSSDAPLLNIDAHGLMIRAAVSKGNSGNTNNTGTNNSTDKPKSNADNEPASFDPVEIEAAAMENGKSIADGINTIASANGDKTKIRDGSIGIIKGVIGTAVSVGKLPENSPQLTEIAEGALQIYDANGDPEKSQQGAEQIAKAIATLSGKSDDVEPYLESGSKIATGIRNIVDGAKTGDKESIASGVQNIVEGSFIIGQRLIHLDVKGSSPDVNLTVSDEARSLIIDGTKGLLSDDKVAGASKIVQGLGKIAEDNLSVYGEIQTTDAPEEEAPAEPADANGAIFPDDMQIDATTGLPSKGPSFEQREAMFEAAKAELSSRNPDAYKGYSDIMGRSKPDANKAIDYLKDQVNAGNITKQEAYGLAALTQHNANVAGSGKINNEVRDRIKAALGLDGPNGYDIIGPGKTRVELFFTGMAVGAAASATGGGRGGLKL